MSSILNKIISKLNLTNKDKAEFIKELKHIQSLQIIKEQNNTNSAYIYTFNDDLENNLSIINQLSVTDNYEVNYQLSETNILKCIYYNGVLTCIKDNKITQYDVNFNTGEITHKVDINPELIGTSVKLELGNSSEIISRNRELLFAASVQAEGQFNITIDYGVGVANFIPQTNSTDIAGAATIMTYNGHFKKYNILDSGEFVEDSPDIDLIELYNAIQNKE